MYYLIPYQKIMPTISQKGNKMPESPIRKLVPYAEDAKKRGVSVFHLNIGQPDIKTPTSSIGCCKKTIRLRHWHMRVQKVLKSIEPNWQNYYVAHNISVEANDIVVTTGGSEALLFTIGSITDPGDEIIIPEPFYANYNGFFYRIWCHCSTRNF